MRGKLRKVQRREKVQFEQSSRFIERRCGSGVVETSTGVVDQNVDASETLDRIPDYSGARGVRRKISSHHQVLRSTHGFQFRFVASRENQTASTRSQYARKFRADALGRPGYYHDFPIERIHSEHPNAGE